jgi:predicted short-subunit dehydrogenase-like oxidoreductase (DUF2520 family)
MRVRIVGPGRAGGSLAQALAEVDGWEVAGVVRRGDELAGAAAGVDLLVIATPDSSIAEVAAAVAPEPETVVMHLAGSVGLEVLAPHHRRAGLHPLVALPAPDVGGRRLLAGATFAVAGDHVAEELAQALGGTTVAVADADRAAYHAAACIASNHLVALLGQAERVGAAAGVPLQAYLELARATLENVAELGPAAAVTGPAARGDEETLARHRAALDPRERPAYDAMVDQIRRLVDEG